MGTAEVEAACKKHPNVAEVAVVGKPHEIKGEGIFAYIVLKSDDTIGEEIEMAKEISGFVKLQCKGGQANPAPPIGPALGSKGINIMEFCKQFNERTKDRPGTILPALLTVYKDKSFTFILKNPPISAAIKKIAKAFKGQSEVKAVADLQYAANDFINEALDSADYALMPIVMTDRLSPHTGAVRSVITSTTRNAICGRPMHGVAGRCARVRRVTTCSAVHRSGREVLRPRTMTRRQC